MAVSAPDDLLRCVDACGDRALRLARGLTGATDAHDLVQQAFVVAAERRDAIPEDDPWPWFARVVVNVSRNARRRRARPADAAAPVDDEPIDERGLDPAELADHGEQLDRLERALAELPEPEREAVLLTHLSGLSHRAAGQALDLPRETVTSRVQRGLERLRRALGVRSGAAAAVLLGGAFAGLEGRPGARTAWLAAAKAPATAAAAGVGVGVAGGLVTGKLAAAVVTAAAIGATWWMARQDGGRPPGPAPTPVVQAPGRSVSPPTTATAVGPGVDARVAELEASLAAERARVAELEARLAQATAPPTVRERVRRLTEVSDARRRSIQGWRLGEELGDDPANQALLLDLLLGERDPATLEALHLVLRSGPLRRWSGAREAELHAALASELPVRRRLAAQLLGGFLRLASDTRSEGPPALVEATRAALVAALRRGDDEVVAAFSGELANYSIAPTPGEADALWAAVDLVETHGARVAALRAIARASYGLGQDPKLGQGALVARWDRERREEVRASIVEALTSTWSQRSGPHGAELEAEGALVERMAPEVRDVTARRRLLRAWIEDVDRFDQANLARLRRLAAREPDPALAAQLEATARRLVTRPGLDTADLDELFSGE